MPQSYSIRESLQGVLGDYIQSSKFLNCTETGNLIRDLTGLLAAYQEEGTALFPTVFVFASVQHIASLAPGTAHIRIGSGRLGEVKADMILKDCAPLAESGWAIYVAKPETAGHIEYGLFRSVKHVIATSADEAMAQGLADIPIISLRNRGPLIVELRNTQDQVFTVSLTPEPAASSYFDAHIRQLAEGLCEAVDEESKTLCIDAIARFLSNAIQRCHGSLCAVIKPQDKPGAPEGFTKSVWLIEPLCWCTAMTEAKKAGTAEALAHLQAVQALIQGMINSDGVVVFGSDGTVLGYRAILSPKDTEVSALPLEGGARRRTHALMCKRLGPLLRVAFFRSQDGKTLCERVTT